jgi:hypothetical protein
MPAAIEASVKRKVIQQWLSGDSRPKIAVDNNIGEGTVGSIVADFKIGLDNSEFDSAREVALQAKKQGLNLSDLASHFRLHNYFRKSGAAEEDVESFIANVSINGASLEKIIQYVNQLYDVSKSESIPPTLLLSSNLSMYLIIKYPNSAICSIVFSSFQNSLVKIVPYGSAEPKTL